MKKILILGGWGFLGQNLSKVFNNSNYEIFLESRRTGCDILNEKNFKNVVSKINPDIIINAAAHVGGVGYVSKKSADVCSDNTMMFVNIFKVISEINPNILLINPLANCSYPGETLDILEESNWWDGIVHNSVESYGNTKKIGFILSECYKKQYGVNTINLLVPNAYGPFDYTDEERTHAMNGIILRLIKAKRENENQFTIWGTGTPIREWVYMEDVAKIIKYIIDNNITNLPNPINLGQENGVSITESVKMVQESLNTNLEIVYDVSKIDGAPKKIMSNKLFKQFFPDFNFTEIKEGIKNTIEYYENII